jgi:hypothetical protein
VGVDQIAQPEETGINLGWGPPLRRPAPNPTPPTPPVPPGICIVPPPPAPPTCRPSIEPAASPPGPGCRRPNRRRRALLVELGAALGLLALLAGLNSGGGPPIDGALLWQSRSAPALSSLERDIALTPSGPDPQWSRQVREDLIRVQRAGPPPGRAKAAQWNQALSEIEAATLTEGQARLSLLALAGDQLVALGADP